MHQKHRKTLGKIVETQTSFFGTIWSTMDPKTVQKRSFFPNALFLHVPWDLPTFSAGGPIPNG